MKILVVEDEVAFVMIYRKILEKEGHRMSVARDGANAINILEKETFDVVISDWMMPNTDGMELVGWIRSTVHPCPFIIVVTALALHQSLKKAFGAGVDEFFEKPLNIPKFVSVLKAYETNGTKKRRTFIPDHSTPSVAFDDVWGVAVVAGGGETAKLRVLVESLRPSPRTVYFAVVHTSSWALEALLEQVKTGTTLPMSIVSGDSHLVHGHVYFAPANHNITISEDGLKVQISDAEKESTIIPSSDLLMKSVAAAFGKKAIGIILGGPGTDGARGAGNIHSVGGTVMVLNPKECGANQMSSNVIDLKMTDYILSLDEIIQKLRLLGRANNPDEQKMFAKGSL